MKLIILLYSLILISLLAFNLGQIIKYKDEKEYSLMIFYIGIFLFTLLIVIRNKDSLFNLQ